MNKLIVPIICFSIIISALIAHQGCITTSEFNQKNEFEQNKSSIISRIIKIEKAIEVYKQDIKRLPGELDDLVFLNEKDKPYWKGPYLEESYLYDLFGEPFLYQLNVNNPKGYEITGYDPYKKLEEKYEQQKIGDIKLSVASQMIQIETGITYFIKNFDKYPDNLKDLYYDPGWPGWTGPYINKSNLYDPWGNPFLYEPNTAAPHGYNLISYGADGKSGGEGENEDIYND